MELYAHQADLVARALKCAVGQGSVIVCSPTGTGKAYMIADIVRRQRENGCSTMVLTHRIEIFNQTCKLLDDIGLKHQYNEIRSGRTDRRGLLVNVAMVGTLLRRIAKRQYSPDLLIIDECHHVAAKTWAALVDGLGSCPRIGFTATPQRLDGKGLGRWFDEIARSNSVRWHIDNGFLAPFRHIAPEEGVLNAKKAGVGTKYGDFNAKELADLVDDRVAAVRTIRKYCQDPLKPFIYFGVGIRDSKNVAERLREAGFKCEHIDGDTPYADRRNAVKAFESGHLDGLCNANLFDEGVNVERCEAVVIGRPTKSVTRYLQMIGRAMRYQGGKTALIVDLCELWQELGLADSPREWTLADKPKDRGGESSSAAMVACDKCKSVLDKRAKKCPFCGFDMETLRVSRKVKEVEGKMRDIGGGEETLDGYAKKSVSINTQAIRIARRHTDYNEFLAEIGNLRRKDGQPPSRGFAMRMWEISKKYRKAS